MLKPGTITSGTGGAPFAPSCWCCCLFRCAAPAELPDAADGGGVLPTAPAASSIRRSRSCVAISPHPPTAGTTDRPGASGGGGGSGSGGGGGSGVHEPAGVTPGPTGPDFSPPVTPTPPARDRAAAAAVTDPGCDGGLPAPADGVPQGGAGRGVAGRVRNRGGGACPAPGRGGPRAPGVRPAAGPPPAPPQPQRSARGSGAAGQRGGGAAMSRPGRSWQIARTSTWFGA